MNAVHARIVEAVRQVVTATGATVEYQTGAKHSFAVVRHTASRTKIAFSNGTKCEKHQIDYARQAALRFVRSLPVSGGDAMPDMSTSYGTRSATRRPSTERLSLKQSAARNSDAAHDTTQRSEKGEG